MNILIISRDKSLFDENSHSLKELIGVVDQIAQIHVIVFANEKDNLTTKNFSNKIFLYPTNSSGGLFEFYEAVKIAEKQVVFSNTLVADLIQAEDPFSCAAAAYVLSRKYKKSFLINMSQTLKASLLKQSGITLWKNKKISNYVLPRAHGIRVTTQSMGEAVCALWPELEKKIYVLERSSDSGVIVQGDPNAEITDIRPKYTQFNLLLVTVLESENKKDIEILYRIVKNMRLHYPRMGLVIIDNNEFGKGAVDPGVVWERGITNLSSYYTSAHIFIDVSTNRDPDGALTEAALLGCPIVSAQNAASAFVIHQGENGFVADPNNLAEFSGRIVEILETPGLRIRIKMFKTELEKLTTKSAEEYYPTLLNIWNKVSTSQEEIEGGAIEQYTKDAVAYTNVAAHTLRDTRKIMKEMASKIHIDMTELGEKIKIEKPTFGPAKRSAERMPIDFKENEVLDVGNILANR